MSNTAPSRADPVVVFPLGRWCPPQETSQPHQPHWYQQVTGRVYMMTLWWQIVSWFQVNKLQWKCDHNTCSKFVWTPWCLNNVAATMHQCFLVASLVFWFKIHLSMWVQFRVPHIAKFMGPTWGPSGSCRPQMGPMLAHELCYLRRHRCFM